VGERARGKAFGATTIRLMRRFRELLNQVWGLEGCPLKGQLVRTNRRGRFVFGGLTVQSVNYQIIWSSDYEC
jgi:hypothetical protein